MATGALGVLQRILRVGFEPVERGLERVFGPAANPFGQLGTVGFFLYWIVAVSGIYLYIFFSTSVTDTYASVERLTHAQWYAGGVMRSLHRYASDAMVVVMLLHVAREFSLDRYRGTRWFSWITGVPLLWFVYASGVTGYWLVWDQLAQYVAIASFEWLDWLPIFGEPIARNFLAPGSLTDRFFTLLVFMHIAIPLILLFAMWVHLQRLSQPRTNPPRTLAAAILAMLVALSLFYPALSQGPADLATVPFQVRLDWFYLAIYPLFDQWSYGAVWALVGGATLLLLLVPWLPPLRRPAPAVIDPAHCNGCGRCVEDCPYTAVALGPRTDGQVHFAQQAVVNPSACVSCGICVGACPSSTPFRRTVELATGIDLPDLPLKELREETHAAYGRACGDTRILAFGCEHGVDVAPLEAEGAGVVKVPCIAMLPPSLIDYCLSRGLADGVMLAGCAESACFNRVGVAWTKDRIAGARDPYLRARVPRERLTTVWAGPSESGRLHEEYLSLRNRVTALPPHRSVSQRPPTAAASVPETVP